MTDNIKEEDSQPPTSNYCDQCGLSLKPLDTIHASRSCNECGKTIYFVQSGERVKGIRYEAGDQLHVPKGIINISLDPASGGKLYRPGLAFLIQTQLFDGGPKNFQDTFNLAENYEKKLDPILQNSPLLKDLNLEAEEDAEKAIEILSERKNTMEWWAFIAVSTAQVARDAIRENDALKAAIAVYTATNAHAMTLIKDKTFEDTLWRGYLANQVVYESAAAAANTPAISEAIKKLEPLFSNLEESVLHTWVNDGQPIGPRMGVSEIPEETLRTLAEWHLNLYSRKREEEIRKTADKRANLEIWIKGIGLGLMIAGALVGVLKYFDIL